MTIDYQSPLFGACLIATSAADASDVSRPELAIMRAEMLYLRVMAAAAAAKAVAENDNGAPNA